MVGKAGIEERHHLRPRISIGSTKLAEVPLGDRVREISHVLELPNIRHASSSSSGQDANVAEGVSGQSSITGINEELDAR